MASLPVAQVQSFKAQGLTNNQIIQALQRDGFSADQIFGAMNQSAIQGTKPGVQSGETRMADFPQPPSNPYAGAQTIAPQGQNIDLTAVEEMVEAVIDEKWNELVKDITTIIEWKNQAQATITSLQQEFHDLKDQFDKLHQALIAKVGEYDKNILDVGAEVKAMEKVFSKVLPVFTSNVAELSKITKSVKEQQHG
jgi:flagellar capping protein FliD